MQSFIKEANKIHNNKYDYSKVNYKNSHTKVDILCYNHGFFKQSPNSHLKNHGCPKCGLEKNAKRRRYSLEDILERCENKYKNEYDYFLIKEYKGIISKVKIKCNKCNTIFEQSLNLHLNSNKEGCPVCKLNRGWKKGEWINYCNSFKSSDPKTYIVRCFNNWEEFIKIGITSKTIGKRFSTIPYSYEVIKEIKGSSDFVWDKEKELHKKFKNYKYIPRIKFRGSSECFTTEILKFYTQ